MSDEIFTTIEVGFSFGDRVRVLLGRRLRVRVVTTTENVVGAASSTSQANVDPLWTRKPSGGKIHSPKGCKPEEGGG